MRLTFCGAAMEVTGSCHLLEVNGVRILLDCGMIQGGDERHERNRQPFPFDPKDLNFVLLSHAHLDHCGRLPLLFKQGYRGKILTTHVSAELAKIALLDSAKIHEEDAEWKIKRLKKAGDDYSWVTPLYTTEDAEACLEQFEGIPYEEWVELEGGIKVCFHDAGHILGSAMIELRLTDEGIERTFIFSGDIGQRGLALVRDPTTVQQADVLLLESTYGDRNHQHVKERTELLLQVVQETAKRGGKVVIPSFAIGRTQELLYAFNDVIESKRLKPLPIFVDSPMAVEATEIFGRHREVYDEEARRRLAVGDNPLSFEGLQLCSTTAQSKQINELKEPCVIIAGSGMCTGGRIKHHLKLNVSDPRSTILFVGFQAEGTLGRQLLDGAKEVRIFGEMHEVRAQVVKLDGFSAHADQSTLLWWASHFQKPPRQTFLVHGEPKALDALRQALSERNWTVTVPALRETWWVGG